MGAFAWNPNDFSGGGGSGNVNGPASATDNAIARYNGATGKLIQNSAATISDAGACVFGNPGTTTQTFNGILLVESTGAGIVRSQTSGTTSDASIRALAGSSSGDAYSLYTGNGSNWYSGGVTSAGTYVVGNASSFGTADRFTISSNGTCTFGNNATTTLVHRFNSATQTIVGSAGAASALPANPTGYIEFDIKGTAYVIPYYDKS